MLLDKIIEANPDDTYLKADGFDKAIIGVDTASGRLIYSVKKAIEVLHEEMSLEDAREYFSFNVEPAYMGEMTPIWCDDDYE